MRHLLRSFSGLLLALAVLILTGCSPKSVEVLSVSGPDSLRTNEPGTFQATTNEDAKPPVMYDWNFGDGDIGAGNPASHAFDQAGTYTVRLTATNRNGKGRDSEETRVVVTVPPVPAQIISLLADPPDPDTETPVRFGANVRGDAPLTYRWSFGDGTTEMGAAPIHTFDRPGSYTVSLEVSNPHGTDTRTLSVLVSSYEADYCTEVFEMSSAFFDRNSSVLNATAESVLRDNLTILQDCPNINVRIEGWAGPMERNPQRISEDRARAVEQFYVNNGVAGSRIDTMGQGRAGMTAKKSGGDQFSRADTIPVRGGM